MKSKQPVEPVLQSIVKAERHIKSEYGTKMVGVMDTIGDWPHFAMPLGDGDVTVISGREKVDVMYKGSTENADPKASRILSQLATDWYMFIENVPTRYWIGMGENRTVQTVTMFTTDDENGITGEYAWERQFPREDAPAGSGVPLPQRELHNLKMHEDLLNALCAGDFSVVSRFFVPGCVWAQRNYLSEVEGGEIHNLRGHAAIAAHLAEWHRQLQPQQVSILNRRVTDWFVFSEELWVVRPGGGEAQQYRIAAIYPVNADGRFEAAMGAGLDIEDLAPSAVEKRGRAYWWDPAYEFSETA